MTPAQRIDQLIAELTDWRGNTLGRLRKIILEADAEIVEDWKWMGSPVWSRDGIIAVGNAHKDKVKLTFANGAFLSDPHNVFNNGLQGNKWRAIDLYEGDDVNERAFKALIRAAVTYNQTKTKEKTGANGRPKAPQAKASKAQPPKAQPPKAKAPTGKASTAKAPIAKPPKAKRT